MPNKFDKFDAIVHNGLKWSNNYHSQVCFSVRTIYMDNRHCRVLMTAIWRPPYFHYNLSPLIPLKKVSDFSTDISVAGTAGTQK